MSASKIINFPGASGPSLRPANDRGEVFVAAPPPGRIVTFRSPFFLPGMSGPHAGGTFEIRETREPLDVQWAAYRITSRIILVDGNSTEALDVTAADLENALAIDAAGMGPLVSEP